VQIRGSKVRWGGRTLLAATVTCAASALPCSTATAQLQLPDLRQTTEDIVQPVQQVVQQPLPAPVEQVVQDTPLAPVREQVREIVGGGAPENPVGELPGGENPVPNLPPGGESPGGGSGGSGNNPSGAAAGADTGSSAPAPAGAEPVAAPQADPPARRGGGSERRRDGGRPDSRRGAGGDDARPGGGSSPGAGAAGDDGAGTALPAAERARRAAARREAANQDETPGVLRRTVDRIVEVVPTVVWIALGGLLIVALALGARALVDNRRARALRRERERLLHDMGLLERVLLPQVPERLGDLAASVAYRPAAGPAAGGDFYDVFELAKGGVALVVGDVSGHGREALERSNTVRPTLRAHLEAGLTPRAAIEATGRATGVDASGGFTTVVAAVHDPSAGTLTYAMAGHPPPIVVGPGAHEPLTVASSPPIGVGIRTGIRQTMLPLPRGSAACFFTDGLLEARCDGALLGQEWLAEVVAEFGPLDSAEALLDRVAEKADETPDDMTACLVRAVAGPEATGPRMEELEVEADDLASGAPERFLAACGVPSEAAEAALSEAGRLAGASGGALLTVTIESGEASVSVTAPAPEALATT
jgi:serine phosphatase RsbU (regulator of sigma subunit)